MPTYIRTYGLKSDGGGIRVHLDGISDSCTLCGFDTSGDDMVHNRPPKILSGKRRVTCEHCQALIEIVKEYIEAD